MMRSMWVLWLAAVVQAATGAHIPGAAAGCRVWTAPAGCSGAAAAVLGLHAGVWC